MSRATDMGVWIGGDRGVVVRAPHSQRGRERKQTEIVRWKGRNGLLALK